MSVSRSKSTASVSIRSVQEVAFYPNLINMTDTRRKAHLIKISKISKSIREVQKVRCNMGIRVG